MRMRENAMKFERAPQCPQEVEEGKSKTKESSVLFMASISKNVAKN